MPLPFVCELCSITCSSEKSLRDHLSSKNHLKKLRQVSNTDCSIFVSGFTPDTSKNSLYVYFSRYSYIRSIHVDKINGRYAFIEFDNSEVVERIIREKHVINNTVLKVQYKKAQTKSFSNYVKDTSVSISEIQEELRQCQMITEQMDKLTEVVSLTQEDIQDRNHLCYLLKQAIKNYYPQCRFLKFGSSVNGVGMKGCDLDLLFEPSPEYWETVHKAADYSMSYIENMLVGRITDEEIFNMTSEDHLKFLINILQSSPICQKAFYIPARCPIIKLVDSKYKLQCDISCSSKLVIYNSELLLFYVKYDDRVKPLLMTLRMWAKLNRLIAVGDLSSYSFTMMVIFFLQNTNPPVLPSVEHLRKKSDRLMKVSGWECSFCSDVDKVEPSLNTLSTEQLLIDFFDFFIKFNFYDFAMCPFSGRSVLRSDFQIFDNEDKAKNFQEGFISIQDPLELSRNVTAFVREKTLLYMIELMIAAKKRLYEQHSVTIYDSEESMHGILSILQDFKLDTNAPAKDDSVSFTILITGNLKNNLMKTDSVCGVVSVEQMKRWMQKICEVILKILNVGFLFETDVMYYADVSVGSKKRKQDDSLCDLEKSPKFLKLDNNCADGSQVKVDINKLSPLNNSSSSISDSNNPSLLLSIKCTAYQETWVGRNKWLKDFAHVSDELELQQKISSSIIEKAGEATEPVTRFLCECSESYIGCPKLVITLNPLLNKKRFKSLGSYLKSYIRRAIEKLL